MKFYKIISVFLVASMLLSLIPFTILATDDNWSLTDSSVEVDGTADKTVSVDFISILPDEAFSLEGDWSTKENEATSYFKLTALAPSKTVAATQNDSSSGHIYWMDLSYNNGIATEENGVIWTATYTVDKNTPAGDYTVSFDGYITSSDFDTHSFSLTATITVTEPAAAADYEIYYTLDKTTDTTPNNRYVEEYNPGDKVTANVYVKTSLVGMKLQAFDVYVENAPKLTRGNVTVESGEVVNEGDNASTNVLLHIQSIGKAVDTLIDRALTAGEGLLIATIEYTIASDVAFGAKLPITIIAGDAANKANIAVSSDELHDPESKYPTLTGDFDGVEIRTQYTITYDDNVAQETITVPADQTKNYGEDIALSSDEPVRTGYTFTGWNTQADGNGTAYAKGATYAENANVTLYAQWEINKYKVTFKDYNGTVIKVDAADENDYREYDYNTAAGSIVKPADPTRADDVDKKYTFNGWTPTIVNVTADAVYTATYTEAPRDYPVEFVMNGHGAQVASQTKGYGSTVDQPTPAPSETGYDFGGWYKDAALTTAWDFANDKVVEANIASEKVTLYAKWTPVTKTVTLDGNGGTPATDHIDVTYAEPAQTLPTEGNVRPGYTFTGWNTKADGTGDPVTTVANLTEDVTYFAQWQAITYQVRFNRNGGADGDNMPNQTFTYDDFTQALSANKFSKENYRFKGWTRTANPADEAEIEFADKAVITSNLADTQDAIVDLYAVWTQDEFTITYNLNGGTVTPENANRTTYSQTGESFTLVNPTKAGYVFDGWTGTGLTEPTVTVTIVPDTTIGNRTYTANWTARTDTPYTVEYYQQNIAGTGYDKVAAEAADSKTGTTDHEFTDAELESFKKTFTGFTFEKFGEDNPAKINGEGNTVIKLYYTRNSHNVTYALEDAVMPGGYAVPTTATVKYGDTYNVEPAPTAAGYEFDGWKKDGTATTSFEMPDEDVELTGKWTALEVKYTVNYIKEDLNDGWDTAHPETDDTKKALTDSTITITADNVGKTYEGFTFDHADPATTTVNGDGSTSINVYFKRNEYTVTYRYTNATVPEGAPDITAAPYAQATVKFGHQVTLAALPTLAAYKFSDSWTIAPAVTVEGNKFDMPAANVEISGTWTAVEYTVTFNGNGGTVDPATRKYTIEDTTLALATAVKPNYNLTGWKVTSVGAESGVWTAGTVYSTTDVIALVKNYGDVTLEAVWEIALEYVCEEYKYAPGVGSDSRYVMIRIANNFSDTNKAYAFDGAKMLKVTGDDNYALGGKDVFVWLLPRNFVTTVGTDIVLTDAGAALITIVNEAATEVARDGKVNSDEVVNIADANAVFQMAHADGGYYSEAQISIAKRLGADIYTGIGDADNDFRGSIKDVNAIVDMVNGKN